MSERVRQLEIVRVDYTDAPPWGPAIEQDPEAPSVSEVVETLRRFVDFHEGECDIGADEGCEGCKLYRDASNLIARLEGA